MGRLSSETVEAAHLVPISARALRSNGSTDFGKVSFFVIGKVFPDFAESRERDGADQGALPLTNGNAQ